MRFAVGTATLAALLWAAFAVFVLSRFTAAAGGARLIPDTLRLIRNLASDRTVPRNARWPIWFLAIYLASPVDVIPDFIPVIGYADDVILTAVVLRRLVTKAGDQKLCEHWPGDMQALASLRLILGIPPDG